MRKVFDFADSRGYRPLPELIDELTGQKLYERSTLRTSFEKC